MRPRMEIFMKRLIIVPLLLFAPLSLFSAFQENGSYNARAKGMGNSFISIADDVSAALYNPAGLSQISGYQFLCNYSKPFVGVEQVNFDYSYFSFATPMAGKGALGFGWNNFKATEIYEEYSIVASYGAALSQLLPYPKLKNISVGANAKYLFHKFNLDIRTTDDPVFQNGSNNSAIDFDFGALFKNFISALPDLNAGFMIKNINEPDIGLVDTDPVYREFGAGFSYNYRSQTKAKFELLSSMDVTLRNGDFNLLGGIEGVFLNRLLIARLGANFNEITAGLGIDYKIMSFCNLNFNYAFSFPLAVAGSYGTHQVALIIKL